MRIGTWWPTIPKTPLKNPHSGIADVELGDLDASGRLKMYLGYLGAVGVQAVPLPLDGGHRLWSNRSISNVGGLTIGAARPAATSRPVLHE